jgi:hypothetical protein
MAKNIFIIACLFIIAGQTFMIHQLRTMSNEIHKLIELLPEPIEYCTWHRGNHILKIDVNNKKLIRETVNRIGEKSREGCK